MSTDDMQLPGIAEFDGRLWDIARLLRRGDLERARVESALLMADSEAAGVDWVTEQLQGLWVAQQTRRTA